MAIGDVYFLRDVQDLLGQQVINTYWYSVVTDATSDNAEDLLLQWLTDVRPEILTIQSEQLTHVLVECFLWSDPQSSFGANATPVVGDDQNNQPLPSNVAVAYRSPYGGPGSRYSYKRFAGITEFYVNGNTISGGAIFEAIEPVLGQNLTGVNGGIFQPVQVQHSSGGIRTLPDLGTGTPIVNRSLQGNWLFRPTVSSQNTRKP
jgi:hypothetical protein